MHTYTTSTLLRIGGCASMEYTANVAPYIRDERVRERERERERERCFVCCWRRRRTLQLVLQAGKPRHEAAALESQQRQTPTTQKCRSPSPTPPRSKIHFRAGSWPGPFVPRIRTCKTALRPFAPQSGLPLPPAPGGRTAGGIPAPCSTVYI